MKATLIKDIPTKQTYPDRAAAPALITKAEETNELCDTRRRPSSGRSQRRLAGVRGMLGNCSAASQMYSFILKAPEKSHSRAVPCPKRHVQMEYCGLSEAENRYRITQRCGSVHTHTTHTLTKAKQCHLHVDQKYSFHPRY